MRIRGKKFFLRKALKEEENKKPKKHDGICFKIGVECGDTLYYTREFDDFNRLIEWIEEKVRKFGWDMAFCNLIIQTYKDNSYDFQNACFMQETLSLGFLRSNMANIEQIIDELIQNHKEINNESRDST